MRPLSASVSSLRTLRASAGPCLGPFKARHGRGRRPPRVKKPAPGYVSAGTAGGGAADADGAGVNGVRGGVVPASRGARPGKPAGCRAWAEVRHRPVGKTEGVTLFFTFWVRREEGGPPCQGAWRPCHGIFAGIAPVSNAAQQTKNPGKPGAPGVRAHRRTVGPVIPRSVASPQSRTPLHRTLFSISDAGFLQSRA